jgi:hypothetical protein
LAAQELEEKKIREKSSRHAYMICTSKLCNALADEFEKIGGVKLHPLMKSISIPTGREFKTATISNENSESFLTQAPPSMI